jgi:DNA-binding transcriptional LysR family regulator
MELDQVRAFLVIVRSGGFARASAELHLSQPAISRRIQLLEREFGAPLFDRLGRGPVLTDAGQAFLPYARAMIASMRDGPRPWRPCAAAVRVQSRSRSSGRWPAAGWPRGCASTALRIPGLTCGCGPR